MLYKACLCLFLRKLYWCMEVCQPAEVESILCGSLQTDLMLAKLSRHGGLKGVRRGWGGRREAIWMEGSNVGRWMGNRRWGSEPSSYDGSKPWCPRQLGAASGCTHLLGFALHPVVVQIRVNPLGLLFQKGKTFSLSHSNKAAAPMVHCIQHRQVRRSASAQLRIVLPEFQTVVLN